MKNKTDHEELLDDVLGEAAPPDFRDALLGESLRTVHRRRHWRQARNALLMLLVTALIGILLWPKKPVSLANAPTVAAPPAPPVVPTAKPLPMPPQPPYRIVDTQPLSADAIIATQPFAPIVVVDSKMIVAIVQTTPGNYRIIGDEELLALLAEHPAVLIHLGPNSEKLIFANPADAKGFPAN